LGAKVVFYFINPSISFRNPLKCKKSIKISITVYRIWRLFRCW